MSKFSRKARAIAAGGAVLGVGAAVTLAAWSDSEFAQGTFASGQFGIQGSADGTTYDDHTDAEGALELTFAAAGIDVEGMQPGQTVEADYWLRTIEGGEASTVTYVGAQGEAGGFTSEVVIGEESLADGADFGLGADGGTQQLTIRVTLDENHDQATATNANIVWQFDAAEAE